MTNRGGRRPQVAVLAVLAAIAVVASPSIPTDAKAAESAREKLVPLKIKLPRPLFTGTPKNIGAAPTLEKYTHKPRPPFHVPAGTENLALHKRVTSSETAPIIGQLDLVTDGDKEGLDNCFVELSPGTQWIQIDLGQVADVFAILIWHYHAEGRVYHDVVVQTADDPDFIENVRTIYNNDFDNSSGLGIGRDREYIDDYRGKLIDAKPKKGDPVRTRYLRLFSKGNTSNSMNHYIEVAVYGKSAQ